LYLHPAETTKGGATFIAPPPASGQLALLTLLVLILLALLALAILLPLLALLTVLLTLLALLPLLLLAVLLALLTLLALLALLILWHDPPPVSLMSAMQKQTPCFARYAMQSMATAS
jgi:hypothetical protein